MKFEKTIYHRSYHEESVEKRWFDWQLIKKLWKYLHPYRYWVFASIFLLLIAKGTEALVPLLIGKMTQHMLDQRAAGSEMLAGITNSALWIVFFLFLSYISDVINVVIKSWIGQKTIFTLRNEVYDHIIHMPIPYYDKNPVGRLMTRTIHDVDQINQMFSEHAIPMLGNFILFIGIYIGIIILDWKIALITLILFPFAFWNVNHFRVNQRRCYDLIRSIVSSMNTFVQEHLMGFSIIRGFGLQARERARFDEINKDHATAFKETIHYFSLFYASIDFMQSISLIAVFAALVAFAPIGAPFQGGAFFAFSLYVMMIFRPLADLAERYNELQSAMAAAERVFDVLHKSTELNSGDPSLTLEEINEIAFNDVWFAYDKENWILKGISFRLVKGESVALVGPTGAGKTSILSLLLRFYEFQKGTITINGIDIRKYPLETLRKQFSVVLQDPIIFSGTLEENITLGNSHISAENVIEQLHMQKFPKEIKERGGTLSVGEMQLISMARAVAHQRSVFMLDEATANIDSGTEKRIQEALKYLISDKTSIVVAHRFSTIKDVKRILVLREGAIVESGSHEELLAAKGLYEKLYRLQFLE